MCTNIFLYRRDTRKYENFFFQLVPLTIHSCVIIHLCETRQISSTYISKMKREEEKKKNLFEKTIEAKRIR